jgi:hypothetical protein
MAVPARLRLHSGSARTWQRGGRVVERAGLPTKTNLPITMLTALKILLIVVLVVVLVAAVGIWWLVRKFKGALKGLAEAAQMFPPCRVHPQPEPNPQWRNPGEIGKYSDQFLAAGFQSAGAFSLPEMAGMQMAAFAHEGERLYGVIYDHQKMPPNFDIVCAYEDGTDLTVTNTKFGEAMDRPPRSPAIRLDGGTVAEALTALQGHPATSPRRPTAVADFAEHFRLAYAKDMNWRLKRGGGTREEIRRQAAKDGTEVTDELVEEVYKTQRATANSRLQEGCIAQYLDEQKPSPTEWEEKQHRVFAIPETFTAEEVMEALSSHLELDEEQEHQLKQIQLAFGETALDFMRRVMEGNIGHLGLVRIGSVAEPVPAHLFLAPESESDGESDD